MKRLISSVLLSSLALIFILTCGCGKAVTPATIDILKTGKSDCIVINTGSHIVMIDTGEINNLPEIRSYMIKNGYEKIDTLILTHYDKDHIGCADIIISNYNVETVIESKAVSESNEYKSYHKTLSKKGISPVKLTENHRFSFDDCQFHIDIPQKSKYKKHNDNNLSLIVSMKCGKTSFLFCADAMETRLEEFMQGEKTKYDFVKLPYHGNYLDNYESFLDFTTPLYTAITCSKKNPPAEKTLGLLKKRSIDVFLTKNGEINIKTDGKSVIINVKE